MSKYLVETFYTCTFKVKHFLDKIDQKELNNIEKRDDGEFEVIDIKIDTRKTKSLEKVHALKNGISVSEVKIENNEKQSENKNIKNNSNFIKNVDDAISNAHIQTNAVGAAELNKTSVQGEGVVFTGENQTFTKAQRGSITASSHTAANIALDFSLNNHFAVTLANNCHLNLPTNLVAGQTGSIFVVQDGTGSRTLSYSSVWDFVGGTAPTLTTTASAVDRIDYVVFSTSRIQAVATLADS